MPPAGKAEANNCQPVIPGQSCRIFPAYPAKGQKQKTLKIHLRTIPPLKQATQRKKTPLPASAWRHHRQPSKTGSPYSKPRHQENQTESSTLILYCDQILLMAKRMMRYKKHCDN
ncbi:MAG: hypothetical protein NC211_01490 [Alistipes senegalensis]|nr:hypothetical protein [Oxalobacter formigenes]MCM1280498.1 hypothetical protein [Alistipes senegalensis]